MSIEIYVGSLSDYNAGTLHGRWIDCTSGVDHVEEEIAAMLAESPYALQYGEPAEEWEILDTNGFCYLSLDGYNLTDICDIAEGIVERGAAYAVFVDTIDTIDHESFKDAFCGYYKSEEDYAYELINDCYTLEGPLAMYFDYEAFARDLFINDYWSADTEDGFAVFRNI